ncbi:hypothetical protein LXM50_17730 [Microbacterium sp. Au-Mic1]|uniref:hypothetical protein n=1 Tax=Microbacterium sp. Au-Mic1 TaxID=2906457 RepID=UPI001E4DB244|nr:hypothetical protein [Microbacterium sp. Au-Mic1]MCE4027820.1 hypothetical protein [Microbacterium sp. Au-Mic1]
MKMNWDDRRADELGPEDAEPARTNDESDPDAGREQSEEGQSDEEQPDEELPPRRVRLGAAWRLPVILAAAAEMDEEGLDAQEDAR